MKTALIGALVFVTTIALPAISSFVPTDAESERWYWQSPSPTGAHLYDVDFASAMIGVAVGGAGDIVLSEDGGATWSQLDKPSLETLNGVDLGGSGGVAAGANGTILSSSDHGATWASRTSGVTSALNGACIVSTSNAIVVGDAGTILQSTDGGSTWIPRASGTAAKLLAVDFANALDGIIVGASSTVLRTSNGGETWSLHQPVGFPGLQSASVDMIDRMNVVACGQMTSTAVRSRDGGLSWSPLLDKPQYALTCLDFADKDHGWIFGFSNQNESTEVFRTSDGGVTWDLAYTPFANSLFAIDASTVIMAGRWGAIFRSNDGGVSWPIVTTSTAFYAINTIDFIDDRNGVVAGVGLKRTKDGGQTWVTQDLGGLGQAADVCFVDSLTGWAVGFDGVSKTQDAGQSWSYTPMGHYVSNVWFATPSLGFITGRRPPYNGPALRRTTNGGANWQEVLGFDGGADFDDIYFIDDVFGWVAHGSGVWRTRNTGTTWSAFGTFAEVNAVWFTSRTKGFAVGDAGAIVQSVDGGVNWTPVASPVSENLRELAFTDPMNGYAAGSTVILRTIDGGTSWFVQARFETMSFRDVDEHGFAAGHLQLNGALVSIHLPETPPPPPTDVGAPTVSFALEQNFPNPFNPATRIRFTVPERSRVRIDVYDVRGTWVSTLLDRSLGAGPGETTWDGRDSTGNRVASGVYFYRMRAGSFNVSRKMVLLR